MDIQIKGLEELRRALTQFSDRRFNAAIATAMTRTAKAVQGEMRDELRTVFDRPTPFTLNALRMWPATADRLVARVGFRDDGTGGVNPNHYMLPNVQGGERRDKRLEAALRAIGALPSGWRAVPGQGAVIDSYGNMSRGQIIQILSQLRVTLASGFDRNMSTDARRQIAAQRRAGGRYFVIQAGNRSGTQPGVYQREFYGRNITPVIVFVSGARYQARWPFWANAQRRAEARITREVERSVGEHIAKLAARKAA